VLTSCYTFMCKKLMSYNCPSPVCLIFSCIHWFICCPLIQRGNRKSAKIPNDCGLFSLLQVRTMHLHLWILDLSTYVFWCRLRIAVMLLYSWFHWRCCQMAALSSPSLVSSSTFFSVCKISGTSSISPSEKPLLYRYSMGLA
jgi:hypothetical protein